MPSHDLQKAVPAMNTDDRALADLIAELRAACDADDARHDGSLLKGFAHHVKSADLRTILDRLEAFHAKPPVPSERLSHYPDYIDDPEGLERFRVSVIEARDRHDMAPVNFNSLGRLIDTIDRQSPPCNPRLP